MIRILSGLDDRLSLMSGLFHPPPNAAARGRRGYAGVRFDRGRRGLPRRGRLPRGRAWRRRCSLQVAMAPLEEEFRCI
ncbi:hypothetical protein GUJ93_ZPchr0019g2662 [Zizania palustris]|uniref:Uncharacterized protein n=1 Tax=Zizania palustris TaxID=103762 RepID=A0A8J5TAS5_ZIZPA|nr:hypothetical protein GUJ93_ZPchr0019g2662 [Zizania palustris]